MTVNKSTIKQLMLYLVVGAGATAVEWVCFYLFNACMGMHYSIATALAFCISTFSNWLLGRWIMFKKTQQGIVKELLQIYLASIIGLIMNLVIMWLAIDCLKINNMMAKVIATGIVFFWNFLVRKMLIYKQ